MSHVHTIFENRNQIKLQPGIVLRTWVGETYIGLYQKFLTAFIADYFKKNFYGGFKKGKKKEKQPSNQLSLFETTEQIIKIDIKSALADFTSKEAEVARALVLVEEHKNVGGKCGNASTTAYNHLTEMRRKAQVNSIDELKIYLTTY